MTALGRRLTTLGRAPVAEWEELAGTIRQPLALPQWFVRWLSRHAWWLLLASHIALLVAFIVGSTNATAVFWLLATATDWCVTRADVQLARLISFAGMKPQLRAALRGLILVGVIASHQVAVGYVLAAVVVHATWLALAAAATWLSRSAPALKFTPANDVQPTPLATYARFYGMAVGAPAVLVAAEAIVVIALIPALDLPSWAIRAAAGLGALVALGYGAIAANAARHILRRRTDDSEELLAELRTAGPRYLVYVSLGAGQSRYIVNQWSVVLDVTPFDGVMLVREASQLVPLRATRVPVVYAPTNRHVEQLSLASIKVAFYLAFGDKNSHLLRDPRLKHVLLHHGDSDKASSANAEARAFDQIWVAGQAGIDRYAAAGIDISADRFVVIGRPQTEPLIADAAEHQRSNRPVILYAPTFEGYYEGTSHSSLDTMGTAMVRTLLDAFPQAQVWFKPHPASGVLRPAMLEAIEEIEALLERGDHVVVDRTGLTLVECLARADVLLSDISSVTTDFMATGRPVLVTDPAGLPVDEFFTAYPSQAGFYVVAPDLAEFEALVRSALEEDPLRAKRTALRTYLLGDLPDGPQHAFDAAMTALVVPS